MARLLQSLPRALVGAVFMAVALSGCGGSGKPAAPAAATRGATAASQGAQAQTTAQPQGFQPQVASAELLVGANRFALGIIDQKTGAPLPDAKVHLRFFELQGNQGTLRFESDAEFRAPAREAGLPTTVEHRHLDGSVHKHSNAEADVGVYTARVTFEKAGQWGVEAQVKAPDGREGVVRTGFDVLATTKTPVPGQPAPRSRQPTTKDVKDISQIDSSAQPDPRLHDMTIADAIATGRPTVVLFATPGFCSSRFCGPEVEVMKKLMPKYDGRINFMHVEVYKDFDKLTPSDTFEEWHLSTEPWFFLIDGKGIITARFDGPTTVGELDAALAQVVS